MRSNTLTRVSNKTLERGMPVLKCSSRITR